MVELKDPVFLKEVHFEFNEDAGKTKPKDVIIYYVSLAMQRFTCSMIIYLRILRVPRTATVTTPQL